MALSRVTAEQRLVLETIYRAYVDSDDWPAHAWLEGQLEQQGLELNATLETIEPGLYWPDWRPGGAVFYAADAQLGLRVAGLAVCAGADVHVGEIVAVVRWLVAEWRALPAVTPQSVPSIQKRTADLITPLATAVGENPPLRDLKLMLDLMRVEPGLPSWGGDPEDVLLRTFVIDRDVRRFSAVETINDLVEVLRPPRPLEVDVAGLLDVASPTPAANQSAALEAGAPPAADAPAGARAPRRRRKFRHSANERLGRWTLRTQLGVGGNAEVWQAEDKESGEIAAVKILHDDRTDGEAYSRFRREIDSINELAREGARVLPIIDHFLPAEPATAWYAMPVAVPIRLALARAGMVDRVAAFAEIADELAHLAERDWHHRDVKPQNLYGHAGRFLVGDFGLIKRPEDEDLTRPERVPGPFEYMPNEAVMRSPDIDAAAVDLYCLTKSLWVVLTENERPPQGQIAAGSYWSLSRIVVDREGIAELDVFVERATDDDPSARGTLRDLAVALSSWVAARRAGAVIAPQAPPPRPALSASGLAPLVADTAADLLALVVELLRRSDEVGLRELVREERRRLEEVVREGVPAKYGTATYGDVTDFWRDVAPIYERVLAVTLPLVRHRSALWADQLGWMARYADTRLLDQGLVVWIEMSRWCAWLFANTCGAFAVVEDNLQVVRSLLTPSGPTAAEGVPLGLLMPGESSVAVGTGMMAELEPEQRYLLPYHAYALRYLAGSDWLRERYGEFAAGESTLRRAFDDFNLLATLAAAKAGRKVMGSWTMSYDGGLELARRIRSSASYRQEVAEAVGAIAEELATDGNELLGAGAVAPGGFITSDAGL